MTMNKAEKAELEQAKALAELRYALRWTAPVSPDVLPPAWGALATGWVPTHDRVEPGCSSSINHAIGRTDKTTSQRAISLYSSKLLALKALRYQVEVRAAEQLRGIDRLIEMESTPPPGEETRG